MSDLSGPHRRAARMWDRATAKRENFLEAQIGEGTHKATHLQSRQRLPKERVQELQALVWGEDVYVLRVFAVNIALGTYGRWTHHVVFVLLCLVIRGRRCDLLRLWTFAGGLFGDLILTAARLVLRRKA